MTAGKYFRIILCATITSYIVTGALLLLTAFLLYQLEPRQSMITLGIQAIYIFSSFLGGFVSGRCAGSRKFLWGMATGSLYFILLFIVSFFTGGIHAYGSRILSTAIMCIGGGMLGGMLS
ncbi:MAG: TIGR04086 family membrane protein [Eubacteriales bacterium]|nr:TIGR04086 family membrane protein [Eubacteriales bacterium]